MGWGNKLRGLLWAWTCLLASLRMLLSVRHTGKSEQNLRVLFPPHFFPSLIHFLHKANTESWHTDTCNNPSQSTLICLHVCVQRKNTPACPFRAQPAQFVCVRKTNLPCCNTLLITTTVHRAPLAAFQTPGSSRENISPRHNKTFTTNESEVFALN